jgi:RNA polymerase sigma-70 factor (sigma-E family)
VKSASERDREFSAFVSAQRAVLVRLAALLLTGDRATAEDVVQTALTRLYVTWPKVRPDTLNAYARRSVVNAVIDDRRKLFRRRERSQAELPDVTTVESRDVDQTAVIALLSTLPARMRAAVVLRYIEGLNAAETADALGCSEGTVRSQSARGLERLRAVFPEHAHNFA